MGLSNYHTNLVQVRPQFLMDNNRTAECVTWWMGSVASGYNITQLTAFAHAWSLAWNAQMPPITDQLTTYTGAYATDFSTPNGLQAFDSFQVKGTGAGKMPNNTAILVSLRQQGKYKGGKGRLYIPALSANVSSDGQNLAAGVQTTVQNFIAALVGNMQGLAAVSGGPANWVIFRQKMQVQPPTHPPTYIPAFTSPVISQVVSTMLATQRRRLRKVAHK